MNNLKIIEKDGLIKVYKTDKGENVVDGRELHEGLGSKQDFSNWIKRRLNECDALENEDFTTFDNFIERENSNLGSKRKEYIVKLDTAKEMAMLERNEKGKEYRRYFIEVEKKYKELQTPQINSRFLFQIAQQLEEKEKQISIMQPKADYFDALVDRKLLTNFRDTAKELKVKERCFMKWLEENEYIYRDSKNKPKPYAKYCPSLFELKEYTNNGHSGNQTLITPKGRETFRLLLIKDGLLEEVA